MHERGEVNLPSVPRPIGACYGQAWAHEAGYSDPAACGVERCRKGSDRSRSCASPFSCAAPEVRFAQEP